ncbi:hypothetical protein MMC07_005463 [Pseudocyphellaria aurata]|nr:hypothetical protein [Pseudocyphellaria aurata]
MSRFVSNTIRRVFLLSAELFNFIVALAAFGLLIWSGVYTQKPGPKVYYSHFTGIYFSACLLFQIIQFFLLVASSTGAIQKRWFLWLSYIYWITLTLSGFMCAVCYSFTPKPDVTAIQFLIFFAGLTGLGVIFVSGSVEASRQNRSGSKDGHLEIVDDTDINFTTARVLSDSTVDFNTSIEEPEMRHQRHRGRAARFFLSSGRILNRFLKVVHWAMSVMFIAGAITLALSYRFENPGKITQVKLSTGQARSLNYNCTVVPSNGTLLPTFWFEGSEAHGIVDFLGLQHFLAVDHGRNSCSYDPPSFGWSENLVSNLEDYYSYFSPLLEALDKQNEERVIVGWGDGGHVGLVHVNERPSATKAFVMFDLSPDGIEWFDLQRKNHWNEKQTLDYRNTDMAGRISLTKIILSIAIPWGLMPIFVPTDKTYFDQSLYPRFHSQSFKEDLWARQYFALVHDASKPIDNYTVTATVPSGIPVFSVMTDVPGDTAEEKASNEFYKSQKLELANHVAGGKLTKEPVWCTESDCSLDFPVLKPRFAADALIGFGI